MKREVVNSNTKKIIPKKKPIWKNLDIKNCKLWLK